MLSSQMEAARHQLKHEQGEASRLFIVDAGLDLAALRQRYPERQRYAIVKGRVRPWSAVDEGRTLVGGYISRTDLARSTCHDNGTRYSPRSTDKTTG